MSGARETGQTPRLNTPLTAAGVDVNGMPLKGCCDGWPECSHVYYAVAARNALLVELETQRQRADQAEAELGRALDAFNASCAETDKFEAALAAARQERDEAHEALKAVRLWPLSTEPIPPEDLARAAELARERGWAGIPPVVDPLRAAVAELAAVRQRETQLREALRILGWRPGHCFCPDTAKRHSDECVAARAVLADTSPPPTLSEPEKSRPEPDAQPLTAGVAQAALESGCSGSLSVRDTSLPEPEPCEFCGDGPCIANCEEAQEAPLRGAPDGAAQ